jgi:ribosomal protein L37E
MNKFCPKCNSWKSKDNFNFCKNRKDKLQLWCKDCGYESKKRHYWTDRKKQVQLLARKYNLKHSFGITIEQYEEMFNKQKGVCIICGKPETQHSHPNGKVDSLRVDHNHKTGKIRGLLCSKCNFGIAQFNDNINLLKKAIIYLKEKKQ